MGHYHLYLDKYGILAVYVSSKQTFTDKRTL